MPIIKFLSRIIVKRPYLNLFLLLIVTLIFANAMLQLKFDTSLSAFVIKNDPDLTYYNKIKDLFETDETIVIGFKASDLFSKKDLEFIKQLSEKIEAIEYVRCVKSLTTTNLTTTTPEMFEVKALVERMPETKEESEIIKRHATTNYLYIKDLASSDGCFGSLLVDIKNDPKKQHTKEVVNAIKHLLKDEAKRTNYKLYLAGDAIINYSLGEYMERDFFVFIIPIYLIMVILMILTMGRWRDVLASLVVITLSLIWSIGSISLMGKTFNNVTIGIIPLVFCIALENIYYIHNIYYDRLRIIADQRRAFQEALVIIFMPCFFSSFTTVIGFGSLMVNTIKPIIDFGILGSITAALAFIISIVFIPSFHILLKIPADLEKEPRFKINAAKLISALSRFIDKRKKWFWTGIPLLIFICVLGILRMRVETDHLTFFHKNSEVYKSTTFIEKNLAGVSNIEITVDTHQEGKIKEPATLKEIEKLVNFLREQKKIEKAMSIVDFLKDMNRAMYNNDESYYRLPETKEAVAQYLLMYSMSPRRNDIEKDFVDFYYRLARIRCRTSEHNSTAIIALTKKIKEFVATNMSPGLDIKITSYPIIYSNMVDSIARGQKNDLIFVVFTLWLCTVIYFRSLTIGTLAMIPNIIPIIFTFGFMGWTGITLNVGTALTSGIAIGLAMDDTTHFFNRFKIEQSRYPDYTQNMYHTYSLLGETMMYSSFVMIATYLILTSSQFHLTALFGFLCALTTLVALCCDLLITPWILITFKPKFR